LTKQRIAMDVDGVLANVSAAVLGRVSLEVGRPVTLADVTSWNWLSRFGLSDDYFARTYCDLWEVYPPDAVEPYERRVGEYMDALCKDNQVDIVTGHNESSRHAVETWLKSHRIPYHDLIMHGCFVSKAGLAYDVIVDDSPSLAKKIAADPRGRLLFLFDQLYNRDIPSSPAVMRVVSLNDVIQHLSEM